MYCVKRTWDFLSIIIILKLYVPSKVCGMVIPSDQIDESKELFTSRTQNPLHLNSSFGSQNDKNNITFIVGNESLEAGETPEDWRNANVTPIFKKGDRNDPANYRPEEVLHFITGLENSNLQEQPHELLENLYINSNAELVGEETKKQDLLSLLRDKNLSGFLEIIKNAGVPYTFTNSNGYPITVFAPINEAFQSFGDEELKDSRYLQSIIFSHIIFGEVFTKNLVDQEFLQAIDGSSLIVNLKPNLTINGHLVLEDNILASNGVIYIVNRILTSTPDVSQTELPQWVREYLPPPQQNKSAVFPSSDESEIPHVTIEDQSSSHS